MTIGVGGQGGPSDSGQQPLEGINYFTSGIAYFDLTYAQLEKWGAKFHELDVGSKPHYDIWIDDKAFWSENFFRETGETYE